MNALAYSKHSFYSDQSDYNDSDHTKNQGGLSLHSGSWTPHHKQSRDYRFPKSPFVAQILTQSSFESKYKAKSTLHVVIAIENMCPKRKSEQKGSDRTETVPLHKNTDADVGIITCYKNLQIHAKLKEL